MCEAEKQLHQEQSSAGSGLLLVQSLPAAGTLLPHLLSSPLVSPQNLAAAPFLTSRLSHGVVPLPCPLRPLSPNPQTSDKAHGHFSAALRLSSSRLKLCSFSGTSPTPSSLHSPLKPPLAPKWLVFSQFQTRPTFFSPVHILWVTRPFPNPSAAPSLS